MFCIVLADRRSIHTDPVNALFWNLVSGWKNLKKLPLRSRVDSESAYFVCRPHPSTSSLRPHSPATSHTTTTMADCMLVFVLQKILSLPGLLGPNILLLCHYAEQRIMDNWLATFVFILCSVSTSTVCIQRTRFMRMRCLVFPVLGEFQAPPIGLE